MWDELKSKIASCLDSIWVNITCAYLELIQHATVDEKKKTPSKVQNIRYAALTNLYIMYILTVNQVLQA